MLKQIAKGATIDLQAVQAAMKGNWEIYAGTTPQSASLSKIIDRGSETAPAMVDDSTFDLGRFAARGNGSHVKLKAISTARPVEAKLGKMVIIYTQSNIL